MELVTREIESQVIEDTAISAIRDRNRFIEANTQKVTLGHLRNDCNIPVFSKDNETTISHYQFISKTMEVVRELLPETVPEQLDIRVSHVIKGRTPSAIGKQVKELKEHEKTIYYERCAFMIKLPNATLDMNGNRLALTVGGVRAYNHENLYSRKSLEKFKVFIGYQNLVCTNLCVSTDGLASNIKIGAISELQGNIERLLMDYDRAQHLEGMRKMHLISLRESGFAHLIGKMRMYQHLPKEEQKSVMPVELNDSQINQVVREYYNCPNFSRNGDRSLNLWKLYNLFTGANKSSYIDRFLDRGVNAYGFIQELANSIENKRPNWYLNN